MLTSLFLQTQAQMACPVWLNNDQALLMHVQTTRGLKELLCLVGVYLQWVIHSEMDGSTIEL